MSTVTIKPHRKKPAKRHLVSFSLSFGIFLLIGMYLSKSYISGWDMKQVLSEEWVISSYGFPPITLETPEELESGQLKIPGNVEKMVSNMNSYFYKNGNKFHIMINNVTYDASVATNLNGAADGSIAEMQSKAGVRSFKFMEEPVMKSGIPGIIQKGSYSLNSNELAFINAVFAEASHLWQITVLYEAEDKYGKQAAERVMNSIQIENNAIAI